ncbi:MAG: hypothetical protein IPJ89_03905 [Candidatus Iainarchaeum archaeon]|uniref:CHAP domain-containing protein n=1 Tax=Candidatus Iainarchaeum sp. TaxID=3101447 RepID=A0A7T9DJ37_9ARCH|nr:MAG: hypothetical protein IPJ89_03905 [Candidatus Diapherotrites archaeon]
MEKNTRFRRLRLALAVASALGLGYGAYHQKYVNDVFPARLEKSHYATTPLGQPISGERLHELPTEAPRYRFGGKSNSNCASYVRQLAHEYFGIDYNSGDAWRFAKRNKLVWQLGKTKQPLQEIIRPGQVLGIQWPGSHYNSWARKYTHLFIVIKRDGNKIIVAHNFGKEFRMGLLEDELARIKGRVIDIIEPRDE